jgi:hypothetical protein
VEADAGAPEQVEVSGAIPERWETTVEDLAQLVGLALDRAQDLADVVNDLARTRPALVKAVAAGTVGAVVGVLLADLTFGRRQGPARSPRGNSVAHERRARGAAATQEASAQEARRASLLHLGDAAELLPIAVAVFGNPVVRKVLMRVALRAARRP